MRLRRTNNHFVWLSLTLIRWRVLKEAFATFKPLLWLEIRMRLRRTNNHFVRLSLTLIRWRALKVNCASGEQNKMLRICFYYAEVRKSSCNKLQTFTLLTIKNKQAYFVLRSACITFVSPKWRVLKNI
jgi:hypothetical protein